MTTSFQELLVACQEGNASRVGGILSSGQVGVNAADENEITAIHVAAANNQDDIIKILLKHGANIDHASSSGWTALMQACYYGHTSSACLLLEHGAKTSLRNRYGSTPLNMAAAAGHLSTVKCLLEAGAPVEEPPLPTVPTCPSPVITAALHGHDLILRSLLNRGAAPDRPAVATGWTPLMFAAVGGSKPSTQILLERGANPDKMNILNATALEIAMAIGNSEVRAYLEKKTAIIPRLGLVEGELDLLGAARLGDTKRARHLLSDKDTSVDMTDGEGATPLILAAIGGHLDIVSLLLGLGANLNHQDRINGWTALMQAVFYCHQDVSRALLEAGANPTITANNGCTALDLATLVDDTDSGLVRMLATHTIRVDPPFLSLSPVLPEKTSIRRPPAPKLAFQTKSYSTAHLDLIKQDMPAARGLKAWWAKFSGRFKNLNREEEGMIVGQNESPADVGPAEPGGEDDSPIGSSVFTLGFTAPPVTSRTLGSLTPPRFSHALHDSSLSPSKVGMPEGREAKLANSPAHLRTQRLLSKSDSVTSSPATSIGQGKSHRATNEKLSKRSKGSRRRKSSMNAPAGHSPSKHHKGDRVYHLLKRLKLEHYHELFVRQEIDSLALRDLSENDLEEIGVVDRKDRRLILEAAKKNAK